MAEDKFEAVDPFALVSKESGFVLFEEVIELIPHDVDGLAADIVQDIAPAEDRGDDRRFDESDDPIEIESIDKTHDPVRLS